MAFVAGQRLTAALLNSEVEAAVEARSLTAYKSANEVVNNSATYQNDDHLVAALEAGAIYAWRAWVMMTSGTTPDFKLQFTVPSSCLIRAGAISWQRTAAAGAQGGDQRTFLESEALLIPGGGTTFSSQATYIDITGLIDNSAGLAGNLQAQWAQITANASDTTVWKGSHMVLTKVT